MSQLQSRSRRRDVKLNISVVKMATSTAILGSVLLISLASIYNKDRFQSGRLLITRKEDPYIICFQDTVIPTPENNNMEIDINQLMELAQQYLGKEGVEQILKGDFSQLEGLGSTLLGGEGGGEFLKTLLNNLPEGEFGRKLKDDENVLTEEQQR